jgi:hypothetical protein
MIKQLRVLPDKSKLEFSNLLASYSLQIILKIY